jgi:uncharacterized membrane protein
MITRMSKVKTAKSAKQWIFVKVFPWSLLIAGIIGLIASFTLTIEKLEVLKNPDYVATCDLNPVISCGSVIRSDQAEVFGFPNPLMGLIGFTAVAVVGGALLAGAQFKRWFWIAFQVGLLFAVGFVHWLMFQTTYRIGALCPYCMVVWVITIPTFWYTLLYNLRSGVIKTPVSWSKVVAFAQRHHLDILLLWYLVIIAVILNHFWYYFSTLI